MTELQLVKDIKLGAELLAALAGIVNFNILRVNTRYRINFYPSAYKWLHEEMKLLHRNVSVKSIMYRLDAKGNVIGVLSDVDLAIVNPGQDNGQVSKQQTGSWPYMSVELLNSADGNPLVYLCRYDLESMMYAILDLACFTHIPKKEREISPIKEWFSMEFTAPHFARGKLGSLMVNEVPKASKGMEKLLPLMHNLLRISRQGYLARGNANDPDMTDEFNNDRSCGLVTLEKFTKPFEL